MLFLSTVVIILVMACKAMVGEISINDEIPEGQLIVDLMTMPSFSQQLISTKSLFRLISVSPFMSYLKIDPDNGKLFSKKVIDRDRLCSEVDLCCTLERVCIISISVAIITKSKATFEPFTQQLQIHIYDLNDHSPSFNPPGINLSISESSPLSTTFPLPLAIDKDSRDYSVKAYRLMSQNHGEVFALDTQLVNNKLVAFLRLSQKLDREQIDRYGLTVIAFDGGDPSLTGTLQVAITVTDVNDNPPVFENTRQEVSIKESQLFRDPIANMVATDQDINENAEIFYKLDSSMSSVENLDLFRIDLRSGSVYLISALDFERQESYKLIILAANRESGMSTATATLTVNVINVNDEKPTIVLDYLSNNQHAAIFENVPAPVFVTIISVIDKDVGISGKVLCLLNNHQDMFDLRQSSTDQFKVFTRQQFDRETLARYSLVVMCQDQGQPPLTTEATIAIIVLDENDNSPEIKSSSTCRVKENKPIGTEVAHVTAIDKDDGLNGRLSYSISDHSGIIASFISIDSASGRMKTTQIIDKESKNPSLSKIDFILTVSDMGTPRLTTTMSMQIIIDDENDNKPQFSQQVYHFSAPENEQPPLRLGQIEVSDTDETGDLRLFLQYSNKGFRNVPFSLTKEKEIYWLLTSKVLDWEEQPVHELIVTATDGAGPKSHRSDASIVVTVIDKNEHRPTFIFPRPSNNSWHFVSFRNKAGFVVLTVSASDKDSPTLGNGRFSFSILSDPANLFSIEPSLGQIKIQRQLAIADIGDHLLRIKVEDQGSPQLSSEMILQMRVIDFTPLSKEKSKENENYDINDQEKSLLLDKETVFVLGLVLLLLIFIICIAVLLYVRHMKGWLHFLPDIISLCHLKEPPTKKDNHRKEGTFFPQNLDSNNLICAKYSTQQFVSSMPPSYCHSPEQLMKNRRDCYEVLKTGSNNSPLRMVPGQSYNDLVTTTMVHQYPDTYLTLHQFPSEAQILSYHQKSRSMKPISSSHWNVNYPSEKQANEHSISLNSQNSYAVSFPVEESTFV